MYFLKKYCFVGEDADFSALALVPSPKLEFASGVEFHIDTYPQIYLIKSTPIYCGCKFAGGIVIPSHAYSGSSGRAYLTRAEPHQCGNPYVEELHLPNSKLFLFFLNFPSLKLMKSKITNSVKNENAANYLELGEKKNWDLFSNYPEKTPMLYGTCVNLLNFVLKE